MNGGKTDKFPVIAKSKFSSLRLFSFSFHSSFKVCYFLSLSHRLRKKELQTFVENQLQDKDRKPESGVTEGLVERQKQASSLIEMFQQEALNEKQTRLLAQLKALEKVCFELLLNM